MIKNGGNGSFRVVFPLVRLVSLLRGFNSSRLRFLNFFNDQDHKEQRNAAKLGFEKEEMWSKLKKGVRALFILVLRPSELRSYESEERHLEGYT
ncbi:hypothetical protein Tco_0530624 [Tanacetum coccineum]